MSFHLYAMTRPVSSSWRRLSTFESHFWQRLDPSVLFAPQGADTPNVQRKRAMLEAEGVKFDGPRLADTSALLGPDDF